jgi:hypothetical protein
LRSMMRLSSVAYQGPAAIKASPARSLPRCGCVEIIATRVNNLNRQRTRRAVIARIVGWRKGASRAVPTSCMEWWARGPHAHSRSPAALPTLASTYSRSRRALRPRLCQKSHRPSDTRGRGECRVPNASAEAWCALGVVSMHTSIHSGGTGNIRHSPRNGFTTYSALSPGNRAFLPPSSARRVSVVANLAPASGRQDHTASPFASIALLSRDARVHRIPPKVL